MPRGTFRQDVGRAGGERRLPAGCLALCCLLGPAACDGGAHQGGPSPGPEITEVDVETPAARVRVTTPFEGVFRVRLSQDPGFPQLESFAVVPSALLATRPVTVDSTDGVVVVHSGDAALR